METQNTSSVSAVDLVAGSVEKAFDMLEKADVTNPNNAVSVDRFAHLNGISEEVRAGIKSDVFAHVYGKIEINRFVLPGDVVYFEVLYVTTGQMWVFRKDAQGFALVDGNQSALDRLQKLLVTEVDGLQRLLSERRFEMIAEKAAGVEFDFVTVSCILALFDLTTTLEFKEFVRKFPVVVSNAEFLQILESEVLVQASFQNARRQAKISEQIARRFDASSKVLDCPLTLSGVKEALTNAWARDIFPLMFRLVVSGQSSEVMGYALLSEALEFCFAQLYKVSEADVSTEEILVYGTYLRSYCAGNDELKNLIKFNLYLLLHYRFLCEYNEQGLIPPNPEAFWNVYKDGLMVKIQNAFVRQIGQHVALWSLLSDPVTDVSIADSLRKYRENGPFFNPEIFCFLMSQVLRIAHRKHVAGGDLEEYLLVLEELILISKQLPESMLFTDEMDRQGVIDFFEMKYTEVLPWHKRKIRQLLKRD